MSEMHKVQNECKDTSVGYIIWVPVWCTYILYLYKVYTYSVSTVTYMKLIPLHLNCFEQVNSFHSNIRNLFNTQLVETQDVNDF